ncbi:helix-turn-helix transcriptional regulator [Actinomadura nitritigenes]|uniref:helix-turn-helix transcriptional regulator n=1 Tax=Actinomadura nitritigenes TaxID=134602 RepID=UPI003D8ACBAA
MNEAISIGPLIAELRAAAGWTQQDLADRLNAITGKALTRWDVSRWETARRIPEADIPALATVLQVPAAMLEEAAARARAVRAGRADLAGLGAVLESQRGLEDQIGAAAVLPGAVANHRAVEAMLCRARGRSREPGARLAASSAQFVGWLHTALRRYGQAGRFYDASLRFASESGDDDAVATALSMRGHLAFRTGDLGEMIAATQAARRRAVLAGTKAITAQQEARGHALEHDELAALRSMDEAEDLFAAEGPDSLYFYSRAMLTMQRGIVLHYLGRHAAAAGHLEAGLATLPADIAGAEWTRWYRETLAVARRRS